MIIWLSMSTGVFERNTQPEAYQREMGHQYIDAGADLWLAAIHMCCRGLSCIMGKWYSVTVWEILCSEVRFRRQCWCRRR